jgi:hypothetical protein
VSKIALFGVVVGMLSTGFTVYRVRKVTKQLEAALHLDESELERVRRHHTDLIKSQGPDKWASFQGILRPMIAYAWAAMFLLATNSQSIEEKDKQARSDLLTAIQSWRSLASPDLGFDAFPRSLNLEQVQQMLGPLLASHDIKDLDKHIPDLSYTFQQLLDVVYLAQPRSPLDEFANSSSRSTSKHGTFDDLQPPAHSGFDDSSPRMLSPIALLQTTYCSLGIGFLLDRRHNQSRKFKRPKNPTELELEILFSSLDPLGTGFVTRNAVLTWTKFLVAAVACSDLNKNTIDDDEANRIVDKWTTTSPTFRHDVNVADEMRDSANSGDSAGGWSKDDFLVFAPKLITGWTSIYAKRNRHNQPNSSTENGHVSLR